LVVCFNEEVVIWSRSKVVIMPPEHLQQFIPQVDASSLRNVFTAKFDPHQAFRIESRLRAELNVLTSRPAPSNRRVRFNNHAALVSLSRRVRRFAIPYASSRKGMPATRKSLRSMTRNASTRHRHRFLLAVASCQAKAIRSPVP
jgi:hypothetical protein